MGTRRKGQVECICDPRSVRLETFLVHQITRTYGLYTQVEAKGRPVVLYILFTFHFTLLLPTAATFFYVWSSSSSSSSLSRLSRDIVSSIYPEFRRSAMYISNFNYLLSLLFAPFTVFFFFFSEFPRRTTRVTLHVSRAAPVAGKN